MSIFCRSSVWRTGAIVCCFVAWKHQCDSSHTETGKKNMDTYLYNLCKDKHAQVSAGATFWCTICSTVQPLRNDKANQKRPKSTEWTYNAQNVIAYIKLRYIILLDKLTKEASIKKSLSLEFSWLNVAGCMIKIKFLMKTCTKSRGNLAQRMVYRHVFMALSCFVARSRRKRYFLVCNGSSFLLSTLSTKSLMC